MNLFKEIEVELIAAIGRLFGAVDTSRVVVEPPRDPSHGDMSTNAAMVLSKQVGDNPRNIAAQIVDALADSQAITGLSVAGPGFINIHVKSNLYTDIINLSLNLKDYGRSAIGDQAKVNVEYVSANPTGPLTVGHARGAVVGDAMANLLDFAGFDVQKEYYINDAGNQVRILGDSAYLRYREALGEDIGDIPAGHYPGEYLKDVAAAAVESQGDQWLGRDDYLPFFRDFAVNYLMQEIKSDLADLGVQHDLFFSENSAVQSGAVDDAMKALDDLGLLYTGVLAPPKGKEPEDWEERPQLLFRSTEFGDDVDRPLKKSDGTYTYFANDIAHFYAIHKQGYNTLINIVGADHGGYVKRAVASFKAITGGAGQLSLPLVAIVNVTDNGKPVKMSKRAGTFITLRDMMERVGAGVIRFIMLTRQPNQTLDFDYARVSEQSRENPVFYVQYAHARCCSVLRHARQDFPDLSLDANDLSALDLSDLWTQENMPVIRRIAEWPRLVEQAAIAQEPHRIAFYLMDLAADFHACWNKGNKDASLRFLIADDPQTTHKRLAFISSVATTLASGLNLLGVEPMQELKSDLSE